MGMSDHVFDSLQDLQEDARNAERVRVERAIGRVFSSFADKAHCMNSQFAHGYSTAIAHIKAEIGMDEPNAM